MSRVETTHVENMNILIIDDNSSSIILLEKILRQNGYKNVKAVTDPKYALKIYNEFRPDLLLLDIRLHGCDGIDILSQIRKIDDNIFLPVIIITPQNDIDSKMVVLKHGAQDYICEPFDNTEILVRIQNALTMRFLHMRIKEDDEQLEYETTKNTKVVGDLQSELIERLLKVAECRDIGSVNHLTRIGMYAYVLAKGTGMSEKESKLLSIAAKLHDIGKIGIPDEILFKPEKLNKDEWEKMKTHTTKGADILKDGSSEIITLAETIALTHHEKWDGTGYPNGLKGDQIPLMGRITALIDVFDALLTERPYKKAWELDKVISYIRSESGLHFDPAVVFAFINNLDELISIYKTYS